MRAEGLSEYSSYAVAVAKHETGNFKSDLFLNKNNAFGFKLPSLIDYKAYPDVYSSARDFALWLKRKNIVSGLSLRGFVLFMKANNYFEDTFDNYYNGVKTWLR